MTAIIIWAGLAYFYMMLITAYWVYWMKGCRRSERHDVFVASLIWPVFWSIIGPVTALMWLYDQIEHAACERSKQ